MRDRLEGEERSGEDDSCSQAVATAVDETWEVAVKADPAIW